MSYDNIFGNIMRAKPVSSFAPKFPKGQYQAILKKYLPKPSTNPATPGTIIEAEFLVAASNNPTVKAGETRGWAWFPDSPGYAGTYNQARAKDFINNVLEAVSGIPGPLEFKDPQGNSLWYHTDEFGRFTTNPPTPKTEHDTQTIGSLLAGGYFIGLQFGADVAQAFKKDGSARKGKGGDDVFNASWTVPLQSMQQINEMRAQIDKIAAAAPVAAPAVQYGGQPQPAPAQYAQPAQAAPAPMQFAPQQPQQAAPVQYAPQPAPNLAPGPTPTGALSDVLAAMRAGGKPNGQG